jgi:hypothetical protein
MLFKMGDGKGKDFMSLYFTGIAFVCFCSAESKNFSFFLILY